MFPLEQIRRVLVLGSAESEMVRLISREIINRIPAYMTTIPRVLNVTDRQTDNLPWQYRAPLGFAR